MLVLYKIILLLRSNLFKGELMNRSCIKGVGAFLPEEIVTNNDLTKYMETSDEWIVKRTGIQERRWCSPNVSNSDLAYEASKQALEMAKLEPKDLDLIVYATLSPDYDFPGAGCFLQNKLGLSETPALDIRQQCTGFIYGLSIADKFIGSGQYKNVLVVGSEIHSKGLDKSTTGRDVSVLFGDGAGACVVSSKESSDGESIIYSTHLHAEGKHRDELCLKAPGCGFGNEERINKEMLEAGLHYPFMNGKKVFVHAIKRMCESIHEAVQYNDFKLEDVDLFLFHQANLRINEAVAENLKIPAHKVFNTIQRYGNTTAATLPIGMNDAIKAGVLKKGMVVAMSAFGSGFTWGSALFKY